MLLGHEKCNNDTMQLQKRFNMNSQKLPLKKHIYSVRQKKVSPKVVCHFLSNHLEFLREILHIYYLFIST